MYLPESASIPQGTKIFQEIEYWQDFARLVVFSLHNYFGILFIYEAPL